MVELTAPERRQSRRVAQVGEKTRVMIIILIFALSKSTISICNTMLI